MGVFIIYNIEKNSENHVMRHKIFPGIELVYHALHSYNFHKNDFIKKENLIIVTFCSVGRIEWEVKNDRCFYLGKGDLSIQRFSNDQKPSFPLKHYHGISLYIDLEKTSPITPMLKSFGVDLPSIFFKFLETDNYYVERLNETIGHVFNELYTIPEQIKETYIQIKILELFLYLSVLEVRNYSDKQIYTRKSDVDTIKKIKDFLVENIDHHITIDEISKKFNVASTSLKVNFKNIYGMPIYTFIRVYRMHKAAWLLKNRDEKVNEIALSVGYNNPSKFSAAFKDELGITPLEYRLSKI